VRYPREGYNLGVQGVVENLNETYVATPAAVAEGRAKLAEYAAAAGATPEQVDAVRLAASEAMTNSVLHAYRGEPGAITVGAEVTAGELWIEIADDGCGLKPRADRPGLGLGLGLISQLSDDFAIVSRPGGGTEVRVRFNLATEREDARARPRVAGRCPGHEGRRPRFTPSMSAA
jgi:serine/threonine-protein kinase RsbW